MNEVDKYDKLFESIKHIGENEVFGNYYNIINSLILKTKQKVIKNINYEMVELYYAIGSTINELIEEYHLEASQNKILKSFSEKLTREFGEGYSVPNLKLMKKFYLTYKDGYTLCNQLSWSHNRLIMNIDNEAKRNFYNIGKIDFFKNKCEFKFCRNLR